MIKRDNSHVFLESEGTGQEIVSWSFDPRPPFFHPSAPSVFWLGNALAACSDNFLGLKCDSGLFLGSVICRVIS